MKNYNNYNKKGNNRKGYIVDGKWCPFSASEMKKGKKGERIAQAHFESIGWKVTDLSDDPAYRKKEIDFLLEKDGMQYTIEIKSSTSAAKKRELVVETVLDCDKMLPGWIFTTEADFLGVVSDNKLFIYIPDEMRKYISRCCWQKLSIKKYKKEHGLTILGDHAKELDWIDPNLQAYEKRFKDKNSVFGSMSEIRYINIQKYTNCGYHFQEIDLDPEIL